MDSEEGSEWGTMAAIAGSSTLPSLFLQVGVGDAVLVELHEGGWWVGQVIHPKAGQGAALTPSFGSPTWIPEQCAP